MPARLAEIDGVEAALEAVLDELPIEPEARQRLVSAVREAVINAVRHGGSGSGARVEVGADLEEGAVAVTVADDGPGFDPASVPDPRAPENLLKASGRGIFLMREFVDQVEYSFPTDRGTVVTLRKAIPVPSALSEERTE